MAGFPPRGGFPPPHHAPHHAPPHAPPHVPHGLWAHALHHFGGNAALAAWVLAHPSFPAAMAAANNNFAVAYQHIINGSGQAQNVNVQVSRARRPAAVTILESKR